MQLVKLLCTSVHCVIDILHLYTVTTPTATSTLCSYCISTGFLSTLPSDICATYVKHISFFAWILACTYNWSHNIIGKAMGLLSKNKTNDRWGKKG